MAEITTIFWDIGGVILTNAWDYEERARASEKFGLDPAVLTARHAELFADFETGRLDLKAYVERTVFYEPRPFSMEAFVDFMKAQSAWLPGSEELLSGLAASGRYRMYALNNESLELNLHRIMTFGLGRFFPVFFSSCFLGARKPNPAIFHVALEMIQQDPASCLFIDDRPANLEAARSVGLRALLCKGASDLTARLPEAGVIP